MNYRGYTIQATNNCGTWIVNANDGAIQLTDNTFGVTEAEMIERMKEAIDKHLDR